MRIYLLFCVMRVFLSCSVFQFESAVTPERHIGQKQLGSFSQLLLLECRVLFPAPVASVGDLKKKKKKRKKKSTSQLIPATKRKTYLFSKIPNYEKQNLAGRCALLSSSWLLFAWVYLPADIQDVTEIHFTTVKTSRPNPVTEWTFSQPL